MNLYILDLFGLTTYIEIFCVYIYYFDAYFHVKPENDIRFLEKRILEKLFILEVIFSLFNCEEIQIFVFPLIYMQFKYFTLAFMKRT